MKYATKEAVLQLINGKYMTDRVLMQLFNKSGYSTENHTKESGYTNIRIKAAKGYIRVYKAHKRRELIVQSWEPIIIRASGIPTFDPSRYSK